MSLKSPVHVYWTFQLELGCASPRSNPGRQTESSSLYSTMDGAKHSQETCFITTATKLSTIIQNVDSYIRQSNNKPAGAGNERNAMIVMKYSTSALYR